MASLSDLQAFRDTLEGIRFSGVLTVDYDGKRITYRSQAELDSALDALNKQIAALEGTTRTRIVRVSTSKGL
jgi:hypothetical protein